MAVSVLPLRGWMLDLAVALDAYRPGFAGSYLRASNERRQVIAAYCAKLTADDENLAAAAVFLSSAGHSAILKAAYGEAPTGLRGALAKAGGQPHDRRFYTILHRFLAFPRHPELRATLQQMTQIDFARLRIINVLPSAICAPTVVEVVGDVSRAKDVARLFARLVESGVDREALARAIRSAQDDKQLKALWDRWIVKCSLPPSPLDQVRACRPIKTAGDLFALARSYRNCAARYVVDALEGRCAFGELPPTNERLGVVIHLQNKRSRWIIEGLFLRQNGRLNSDLRDDIQKQLVEAGAILPRPPVADTGEWSSLRRLTSRHLWDYEE